MMTPILLKKKDEPALEMWYKSGEGMKKGQELCILVARSNVGKSKINLDEKIDRKDCVQKNS